MTQPAAQHILIIEDDAALNRMMCDQLKRLGYVAMGARSLAEADTVMHNHEPTLVLLDIRLPDTKGLEAISRFGDICPIVILTAFGSVDQAVEAVRGRGFRLSDQARLDWQAPDSYQSRD